MLIAGSMVVNAVVTTNSVPTKFILFNLEAFPGNAMLGLLWITCTDKSIAGYFHKPKSDF